eukprot:CAMPEP_0113514842 /NCGR_PEP_ID=MMETSP0014_2-20120614/40625_1 /TAXON_ID=2857 /ORGANISM="Nitzschia sp." /LENGTH=275 /DNA_ID=CAMNT_0000411367 /DNA_START=281 /DNA_END=1108 /DNA_ORIENTATION=+ /assembly_acc=CAM_ASM_000159
MESHHDDDTDSLVAASGIENIEEESTRLTWRSHPSDSFSDWKIMVKSVPMHSSSSDSSIKSEKGPDTVSTYFVHRNILALGQRRSGYFSNLFHYAIDDGDRCTNIEISSRAAEHFPDLLDYMYFSRAFAVTTNNAVPLLFLAQSLHVKSLLRLVEDFLEDDLRKLFNFGTYLSDALYFSDPRIVGSIRDTGGKEVRELTLAASTWSFGSLLKSSLSTSASRFRCQAQDMWLFVSRFPKRLLVQANHRHDSATILVKKDRQEEEEDHDGVCTTYST